MSLSQYDRDLLKRCLNKTPRSWESFADRFTGLIYSVVRWSASKRGIELSRADISDLVADVFLEIIRDDFAALRRFRGESSLHSYLTVIARRIVVRQLASWQTVNTEFEESDFADESNVREQFEDARDEIEQLLDCLDGNQRKLVELFHLQENSYADISKITGVPVNSIGPSLARAREKMRAAKVRPT